MDNTNNIGSFRSVYMAYGAFKVESNGAGTKNASQVNTENGEIPSFLTAMSLAVEKTAGAETSSSEDNEENLGTNLVWGKNDEADEASDTNSGKTAGLRSNPYGGAFLSYTRIITANIPSDIASDFKTGANGSAFDYSGGGQELKITINVSGGSRIYTASGVDKNGNAFEKEIDPYNVDPTDTDYAGFATLCAYIRDTEGMADNAMQAVRDAAPADITENGNYLLKVGFMSTSNGNLSGAKKLFEQMQNFFEKLMNLTSDSGVKGVSGENITVVRSDGVNGINGDEETESTNLLKNSSSDSAGNVSKLSDGSKGGYSRILEELQEMIQLMIQQMLNEIMGIDSDAAEASEAEANANEKAETVAEASEPVTPYSEAEEAEKSGYIPGVTDGSDKTEGSEGLSGEDAMKNSLNLENATEL